MHHKKAFKKKKVKANAPISQTSSERLKITTQTNRMENKELNEVGKLQEEISKTRLPVNYFGNQPKKNFVLHEVILGGAAKTSTIF